MPLTGLWTVLYMYMLYSLKSSEHSEVWYLVVKTEK